MNKLIYGLFVLLLLSACQPSTPDTSDSIPVETAPSGGLPALPEAPAVDETPPSGAAPTITLEALAAHNSASDCWVGYDGEVFDITSFLPRHPGGIQAIAPHCGTSDSFEKAFTKKHGTSKVSNLKKQGLFKGTIA